MSVKDIKSRIAAAFEKIGHTNGTTPPDTQDPLDRALHEYNVCAMGESHFKKRREIAKKKLEKIIGEDGLSRLARARAQVAKNELAVHVLVASSHVYSLDVHVKNGASYLDDKALRVELMKMLDSDKVEQLWAKHTKRRDPSCTYGVLENDGAMEGVS